MPVSFSFVPGTTREQAQALLHRIGEMPDVETFSEVDSATAPAGELAAFVVYERSGDSASEEEQARESIRLALRKSSCVGSINTEHQP